MFDWYKRLRHSKGFGIHSPSAYRIIREVLCPSRSYRYFAEFNELRRLKKDGYTYGELCTFYRFLVDCAPKSVALTGGRVEPLRKIIKLACPRAKFTDDIQESDLLVASQTMLKISGALPSVMYLFNIDSSVADDLIADIAVGHIFRSKRHILIQNNASLPRQIFHLNF